MIVRWDGRSTWWSRDVMGKRGRASTGVSIREFASARDAQAVRGIDSSYSSDFVFDVTIEGESVHLRPVHAATTLHKRFTIDLEQGVCEHCFVAVEGGIVCGFIAMGFESWHRRLAIWHFYVDLHHRRRGIGRRLMTHALSVGCRLGAVTAWVETSNHNYPGIIAYHRLGFSLSGFDSTLYVGTPSAGEFGIFMSRPLP